MTTPIEPNVLKIYAKRLTIGMWVTKIDGSRAQVIPQTGVRLQDA